MRCHDPPGPGIPHFPDPHRPAQALVMRAAGARAQTKHEVESAQLSCAFKTQVCVCLCGAPLSEPSVIWIVQHPKGRPTKPAARLFGPEELGSIAKRYREAAAAGSQESHPLASQGPFQMQGSGKSSKSILWSLSSPDPACPTGRRIAIAEHTSSEFYASGRKEESEVFSGVLNQSACPGFLGLLASLNPGSCRAGEAVIRPTVQSSGLQNINTEN